MHAYVALKVVHIVGVLLAFTGVAGIATHAASGRPKGENPVRTLLSALHGTGLLLVVLAGLGMLAQLMRAPGAPSPAWATTKLLLWGLLVGAAMVPYRWPKAAKWVLIAGLPLLAAAAAVVAILKPF
jgi:hypothetical protein